MNKDKLRSFYFLWWECLKRSKKYEQFCSSVRRSKAVLESLRYLPNGELNPLFNTYILFGDVFVREYEDFWGEVEPYKDEAREVVVLRPDRLRKIISRAVDFTIYDLESSTDRSDSKFKENLSSHILSMIDISHGCLIAINFFTDKKTKELARLIYQAVKEEKTRFFTRPDTIRSYERWMKRNWATSRYVYLDHISEYLQVFDLRKAGKTWWEIALEMPHPRMPKDGNIDSEVFKAEIKVDLQRKFRKAQRIIKNVEKGTFPGDYQDNSRETK